MLRTASFPAAVVDCDLAITMLNPAMRDATRTDLDCPAPLASLPFVNGDARAAAIATVKAALSGTHQGAVPRRTLYLKLWTDRGEAVISVTALRIGPDTEASRPVALYGQILDHDVLAGLRLHKGVDGSAPDASSDVGPKRTSGGTSASDTAASDTFTWVRPDSPDECDASEDSVSELSFASGLKQRKRLKGQAPIKTTRPRASPGRYPDPDPDPDPQRNGEISRLRGLCDGCRRRKSRAL